MSSYKVVRVSLDDARYPYDDSGKYIGSTKDVFEFLEKKVNILIEQGWSCTGGVLIDDSRENFIEMYDIISGRYDFVDTEGGSYDFYTRELYPSFTKFKQNVSALKRAENPLHRSYIINSNLIDKCRLVKGGSFLDEPHYLLLNNSQVYHKDDASCRIGFRIAADVIGNEMNKYDKKRFKKLNKLGFYGQ